MLIALIAWIIIGILAGGIARLVVPGRHEMGCISTILLGIVGSFVGGTLGNLLFDEEWDVSASGLLGSMIGAILTLFVWRALSRR